MSTLATVTTTVTSIPPAPPKPPPPPPKPKPPVAESAAVSGSALSGAPTGTLSPSNTQNNGAVPPNPTNSLHPTDSSRPTPLSPTAGNETHHSVAAAAGIGTGIALGVIILAMSLFFWLQRRRKNKQKQRRKSTGTLSYDEAASPDMEIARRPSRNPGTQPPLQASQTHPIELPAPTATLQTQQRPPASRTASKMSRERFGFTDHLDVVGQDEKKLGVRLFDDEPVDVIEGHPAMRGGVERDGTREGQQGGGGTDDEELPSFTDLYPDTVSRGTGLPDR